MPNTTACTASSATVAALGASTKETASTKVVTVAAKRGPRGSIPADDGSVAVPLDRAVVDIRLLLAGRGRTARGLDGLFGLR